MSVPVPIIAGGGIGFHGVYKKAEVSSTSPTEGCDSMTKDEFNKAAQAIGDAELREKVASKMLKLGDEIKEHEKRAHAVKVLYKQAELGLGTIPTSYSEYEQKIASLVSQDLAVLEKALELSAGDTKIGDLSKYAMSSQDAAVQFQEQIMDLDA